MKRFFYSVSPQYQEALDKAGYKHKLVYDPTATTGKSGKRYRSKPITWFNPPFSLNVQTNVGKKFLQVLDSCFLPDHPLHSLLHRNTIKISYRTMPNMGTNISRHNSKILNKDEPTKITTGCNCQKSRVTGLPSVQHYLNFKQKNIQQKF